MVDVLSTWLDLLRMSAATLGRQVLGVEGVIAGVLLVTYFLGFGARVNRLESQIGSRWAKVPKKWPLLVLALWFLVVLLVTVHDRIASADAEVSRLEEQVEDLEDDVEELEKAADDRAARRAVLTALEAFYQEGEALRIGSIDETAPADFERFDQWVNEVEAYLSTNPLLGPSYVARFRSTVGMPLRGSPIRSRDHRRLNNSIHTRLFNLDKFVADFRL